ncbi:hypothetical protein [Hymenobacter terricola]|uniref:hypothetical protein n=1 Tax=Hymenobacter terricola TaxID=2819236 RepID=UPI001B315CBE|nr:hypothetical protein [Hymenobacter terricola]
MLSTSPLASVHEVIQQIRANASANASLFRNNEAATRAALIDPILRALGWDTANVRMVEPERMVANKQSLDYVLKDTQGNIRSVVEAKKLGESLDKLGHVGALIGYAFSLKPTNFFITDGLNWHYYSPAHSSYEPVATLNLQEADTVAAALQLVQWLDAAQSGHGIQPDFGPTPSHAGSPLLKQPQLTKPTAKPLAKPKKPQPEAADFTDVSQLHLQDLPAGQKPKQLRLPNGSVKSISTWKGILLEVCRLVLVTNLHLQLPLPDKAGKSRFLFSDKKPEKGSSSTASYKGKLIFIGTHYSAADCIANALYALAQLPAGQNSTTLAVSF